ncbi:MAG: polysaccharide biosynthesis tyrosine autokinase [Pyrinomonadaceae bacterium]
MEQDQRLTPLPKGVSLNPAVPANYPPAYSSYFDDESLEGRVSIRQYLNVVYKRLPLIIALAVLITAAAALYMYAQPNVYQSNAQIIIEPRRPKMTSKDSININFGQDANYLQTQLLLLQGPELKKAAIIDLGLHRQPGLVEKESRGVGDILRSIFSSEKKPEGDSASLPVISETGTSNDGQPAQLTAEEDSKAATIALKFQVSVDQVERTNIVNLGVRSEYPDLAPKVALAMAREFRKSDADREMAGARKAVDDLGKSIEELRNTINEQDLQMIAQMKDQDLSLAEKGQDLAASRLSTMSATYLKTMEERRNLEGRYNTALAANARGEGASIPELRDSAIYVDAVRQSTERKAKLQDDIRAIDKQIQTAETERAELLVKYTEEYADVKKMDERISALKASKVSMDQEVTKLIDEGKKSVDKDAVNGALVSLRAQLDSKRREEGQALSAYEQEYSKANVQGQAITSLTTLKRQIETNRTLLDTYIQRQQEQTLAIANTEPDNIKVPAEAGSAGVVGPARLRNISLAFLLSLVAGVGLAFLMDYLDDSVKTSDDISRHLGLPTLALIPHYSVGSNRKQLAGANTNGGAGPPTGLITLEERQSPMAEAYRHLRTSLLFSSAGKPPQTILVTSSQPSEGKTTTAVNTAITLAQSDADVVIIDCDLRRPRLHSYFNLENTKGLTNYLSGERNTDNLIKQCADLPRLKVITSGPIPPNPTELLSSNEMRNLLQFLRGRYKHVVIDSPPAISFTDAAILSTQVDGVILVAMANKSSIHLMRRFKQRLGTIGARIYGVVLNGIKSGSMEYDYYGSGYYDYYKSADDESTTPVMESAATNGKS